MALNRMEPCRSITLMEIQDGRSPPDSEVSDGPLGPTDSTKTFSPNFFMTYTPPSLIKSANPTLLDSLYKVEIVHQKPPPRCGIHTRAGWIDRVRYRGRGLRV